MAVDVAAVSFFQRIIDYWIYYNSLVIAIIILYALLVANISSVSTAFFPPLCAVFAFYNFLCFFLFSTVVLESQEATIIYLPYLISVETIIDQIAVVGLDRKSVV